MLTDYFGGKEDKGHVRVIDDKGGPLGVAYYQPKTAADRVWDLTMIAVKPAYQRRGRGAAMLRHVEEDPRGRGYTGVHPMNTVQYVGLPGLAGFWATASAGFLCHSVGLGVRSAAWIPGASFAASFAAFCLVASYCLMQLLKGYFI